MTTFSFLAMVVAPVLTFLFIAIMVSKQYKRCPSNRILVVYGKVAGEKAARCIHGGGQFIVPLIQDYTFLSLEPMTIDIELNGALSKKNIRVNVPSTFTIGISTHPSTMNSAAERLLGLNDAQIADQARDIILGQLRLVIATLSIEEINGDREKFLEQINNNVNTELNKIGLEVINVNIRDITDESGYIGAIGKKAAAEAINRAKVEVAEQERDGAVGEETALRERAVQVSAQQAEATIGQKSAERRERVESSRLEAEAIVGQKDAEKTQRVQSAILEADAAIGSKEAENRQRVESAKLEASAVEGENESKARIAEYNAKLYVRQADAKRQGEVASAESTRDILRAQKEEQVARLEKTELAQKEVDKRKVEIEAEAEAERIRRVARGEADAVLAKYEAEADGIRKVLQAKAEGYERLMLTCGDRKELVPTLLMVEQMPDLIKEQVKAIQNIDFGKITVWDSGGGNGEGSTANFIRSIGAVLPPIHELAKQAGIHLPGFLGKLNDETNEELPVRKNGSGEGSVPPPIIPSH